MTHALRQFSRRSLLTVAAFLLLYAGLYAQNAVSGPAAASTLQSPPGYQKEIADWQTKRTTDLKAPDGWLNLVGLYWLDEGKNSFGSGPHNKIVFPAGTIPEEAGYFERSGNTVPPRRSSPKTPAGPPSCLTATCGGRSFNARIRSASGLDI